MPVLGGKSTNLQILLTLKDQATAKLKGFSQSFDSMASRIAKGAALAGGAMAVGIGVKSVQAAADFEKAMSNVATLVDTNVESMKNMGKEVQEIAKRVPVDIGELTTGLYQVRSAGIDASNAMNVLESSAKLAVAGLGTTEEATNLLTSAMNVFEKQGYSSEQMANILFKTVKAGKTTVAGLAQAFGMLAPIAGEMNVDLGEMQAATAALTTTGQTASVAQTQLRAAIVSLIKPTGEMKDLFDKLGVESGRQLLETSGGLVESFRKIKGATEGNDEVLSKAIGSVEGLNAVLALTSGDVGESFISTFEMMKNETDLLTEGLEKQRATTAAQYQLLKNELNVAFIELGTLILPHLVEMIKWTIKWFKNFMIGAKSFGEWWQKWVIEPLGQAIFHIENFIGKVSQAINFLKQLESAINPVKNMFRAGKAVTAPLADLYGNVKGMLGFQHGGVVPGPIGQPMPAIVHGGETVIPAGKRSGVVVNIYGGTYLSREVAEEIGNEIIEKLKFQLRM